MTRWNYKSGTERIGEAAVALGLEDNKIVVCLQADEPLIPPDIIDYKLKLMNSNDKTRFLN